MHGDGLPLPVAQAQSCTRGACFEGGALALKALPLPTPLQLINPSLPARHLFAFTVSVAAKQTIC